MGALSDELKTVVVPLDGWHRNTTLSLPCHDSLPYKVKVELVEQVTVDGKNALYGKLSEEQEVNLPCPWNKLAWLTGKGALCSFKVEKWACLTLIVLVLCTYV